VYGRDHTHGTDHVSLRPAPGGSSIDAGTVRVIGWGSGSSRQVWLDELRHLRFHVELSLCFRYLYFARSPLRMFCCSEPTGGTLGGRTATFNRQGERGEGTGGGFVANEFLADLHRSRNIPGIGRTMPAAASSTCVSLTCVRRLAALFIGKVDHGAIEEGASASIARASVERRS